MKKWFLQFICGFIGLLYILGVYWFFWEVKVLEILAGAKFEAEILSVTMAIAIFCVMIVLLTLIQYIIGGILKKIAQKTKGKLDDLIVDMVYEGFYYLKYVVALYVAWNVLKLPEKFTAMGDKILYVIMIFIVSLFLSKMTKIILEQGIFKKVGSKRVSKAIINFVEKVIIVCIWVWGVITALSSLGYNISALIAWAGVGGIAIALAAQKSVANIFGAITILLNKPLEIGDYVTIGSTTGTVKDIGLTYIILIDRLGHEVSIPNETIISSSIQNESRREYRRADFSLGLIYDTTLEQMKRGVQIVEEILQSYVEQERLQKFRVNFDAFGDFSLNINITYFTNTQAYNDFVKEKEAINLEIKERFAEAGLEMAFPTTEMIIKNGELK